MIFVSRKPTYRYDLIKDILVDVRRDDLRKLAQKYDIPRGRNKSDTIQNILEHRDKFKIHYLAMCI